MRRSAPTGGVFLPQLDALRGAAVLAVFVQHLGDRFRPLWETWLGEGFVLSILRHAHVGVDLFFVVSGFSLARAFILAFESNRSAPPTLPFLVRRALRIAPAFVVALAVHLALRPALFADPSLPASLAVHLALLQGYAAPGGIVIIGAAWSLTTEAQFYLLLPLLARPLLAPPRSLRPFLIGAAVCTGAWVLRGALHEAVLDPGHVTGLLEATQRRFVLCRLDQFVLGALVALAQARLRRPLRHPRVGVVASLVALTIALRLEGAFYLEPFGAWPYPLVSLSLAALVLFAVSTEAAWAAPSPLVKVGVVSYGVFLYHQLAIEHVGAALPGPDGALRLVEVGGLALIASIVLGALSYRWIEIPAIALSRRITSRGLAAPEPEAAPAR